MSSEETIYYKREKENQETACIKINLGRKYQTQTNAIGERNENWNKRNT